MILCRLENVILLILSELIKYDSLYLINKKDLLGHAEVWHWEGFRYLVSTIMPSNDQVHIMSQSVFYFLAKDPDGKCSMTCLSNIFHFATEILNRNYLSHEWKWNGSFLSSFFRLLNISSITELMPFALCHLI